MKRSLSRGFSSSSRAFFTYHRVMRNFLIIFVHDRNFRYARTIDYAHASLLNTIFRIYQWTSTGHDYNRSSYKKKETKFLPCSMIFFHFTKFTEWFQQVWVGFEPETCELLAERLERPSYFMVGESFGWYRNDASNFNFWFLVRVSSRYRYHHFFHFTNTQICFKN